MYQLTTNILRDGELLLAGTQMTTEEIGGETILQRWLHFGMCVPVEENAGAQVALPAVEPPPGGGEPTPEAVG